jgi:hypothetical protein
MIKMSRPAWLTLGLLACASCGGKVVSMEGPDARIGVEVPPPVRGGTDASVGQTPDTATTTPPPPGDSGIDLAPAVDLRPRRPDAGVTPPDLGVMGMDAAPDVVLGQRCNVQLGNCPNGSYCYAPACGVNGNCVVAETTAQQDPLCGCDRITYWNGAVAAASNASIRGAGACPADLDTICGGANPPCPNGSVCNLQQENAAACMANAAGRCWTLPANCPALPAGSMPSTRRCVGGGANAPCQSVCDLIAADRVFRVDDTCPLPP